LENSAILLCFAISNRFFFSKKLSTVLQQNLHVLLILQELKLND